jgi:eukaryotic-like serine/threonine-protein kinase
MSTSGIDHVRACLGSKYEIERELGRGGMGAVYLARDLRLDRAVALKVLPPEFSTDQALRERFLRETRTSASFSHPNIVPVHAIEETEDILAFAMGYIEGESLAEKIRRTGALGTRELVKLLQDLGYALAYAHGRGVVHRDLKPDNIMIERATGRAMLMDFGIARAITLVSDTPVPAGLTRVGEVVGTPEYMSPEQATADTLDGRSDIYSLGLVAFYAATGRTVMSGTTPRSIMVRQLTETVPPLSAERGDLPVALTSAIDRCVAKDPKARFQSAEALVEAIDAAQLSAPEIPIPIRGFAGELSTVTLFTFVILLLGYWAYRNGPERIGTIERLLPFVGGLGIILTRVLQSLSVVRRLAEEGYTAADIMRGLRGTVDEQAMLREQIRRSPASHRRRRRTIVIALLQLVAGVGLIYLTNTMRPDTPPPTPKIVVPAPVPTPEPPPLRAVVTAFSGLMLIAVSGVLLSRSPFRMGPGERVFRLVWLGPIGRTFVSFGARRGGKLAAEVRADRSPSVARPVAARTGITTLPPMPAAPSLAALEARVAALEQWRDSQQSPRGDD